MSSEHRPQGSGILDRDMGSVENLMTTGNCHAIYPPRHRQTTKPYWSGAQPRKRYVITSSNFVSGGSASLTAMLA
jgi:hypothetical protein